MEPDSLEARVEALETEVRELARRVQASEQDAAAARILAGVADRDDTQFHAELRAFRRATVASFNALREEMIERFGHVDKRFARIDERLTRIDERFDRVDERFTRVDERFRGVDAHFASVEERFDRVDNGFIEMRGKFDAAAAGQQHIVNLLERLIADQG